MHAMPDQLTSFLTRYSLCVQSLNVCFYLIMNVWLTFVMCDFDFPPYKSAYMFACILNISFLPHNVYNVCLV